MKKVLFCLICTTLLMAGCGQRRSASSTAQNTTSDNNTTQSATLPGNAEMTLQNGSATATLEKSAGENVRITFDHTSGGYLRAVISSGDQSANLRFTQIVMPDGTADGPFGMEVTYALTQSGRYTLIVGENMMAGDPWGGRFTVSLTVSENQPVPYTIAHNYFVRNDFSAPESVVMKITDRPQFDKVFGQAATMGSSPTPIDFSYQYALALILPVTDRATELSVAGLEKRGGNLVLRYSHQTGEQQSYTIRPALLIVVDDTYDGEPVAEKVE